MSNTFGSPSGSRISGSKIAPIVMGFNEELNLDTLCQNPVMANSDTIHNKRARRVSFAERTSIHFFDRDEYNSTPQQDTENDFRGSSALDFGEKGDRFKGFGSNDDDDVDEAMEIRSSFLRPTGSPSPGESTVGSSTSLDEDHLFGPVSAHFIRPGQLFDSEDGNDDHDVTMDSTAFSMHYRSLARSDSETHTPSRVQLFHEEMPTDEIAGSTMAYTLNKIVPKNSAVSDVNCNSSSSDMTLIGENHQSYDYEKLSPRLNALLVESRKDLQKNGISENHASSISANKFEAFPPVHHNSEPFGLVNDTRKKEPGKIDSEIKVNVNDFADEREFSEENDHLGNSHGCRTAQILSPSRFDGKCCETVTDILPCEVLEYEAKLMTPASPVKQEPILLTATCSPGKHLHSSSHLMKQPDSSFQNGRTELNDAGMFTGKSGSLQRSVLNSAFTAKVDISTIRALDFVKSPTYGATLLRNYGSSAGSVAENNSSSLKSHEKISTSILNHLHHDEQCVGDVVERFSNPIMIEKPPAELGSKNISPSGCRGAVPSTSPTAWAHNNLFRSLFSPRASTEDVAAVKTVSSLGKVVSRDGDPTKLSQNFFSPKTLEKSFPASPSVQYGQSRNSFPQLKSKEGLEFKSSPARNFVHSSLSPVADNMNVERISVPSVPLSGVKRQLDLTEFNATDDREIDIHRKKVFGRIDVANQTGMGYSGMENSETKEQNRNIPHEGAIPSYANHSLYERSLKNVHHSPVQNNFPATMNIEQERLRCPDKRMELINIQGSPKNHRFNDFILGVLRSSVGNMNISSREGGGSFDIDAVEDILVGQHRSRMYGMLHRDAVSQSASQLHDPRNEKLIEAKSMLYEVLFGKASLQLMCLKNDTILKKQMLLSSRIHESHAMKAVVLSQTSLSSSTCALDQPVDCLSSSGNLKSDTVEKIVALEHECNALEMEISTLVRSFCKCCDPKADPSIGGRMASINKHLMKTASHWRMHQDMQNWVLHSLNSLSGRQEIVLNYHDLVRQIFQNTLNPTSLATSFELEEQNISKSFPNMDASTAFEFLLKPKILSGVVGARTLVLETQVSNSLFGNLLDVIEEVQFAKMELHNLMQTRFYLGIAGGLHLMLSFFGFKIGRKVTIALDVTCLKCGIYPSQAIPIQVGCSFEPLLNMIREEVKAVGNGYMRIFRLCRAVSQSLDAMEI